MKVLSLFDGMSCGRIALDQMGIKVDTYYASEIDKYAMEVSKANYPDTIYVGDVCNLDPKDYMDVDLILAGSPCQGFSMAGKQLAFDDPRSALFFEFIRLLKEIKPKYFLLENVRMKKEYLQVISEQVSACYPEIPFGIEPTMICSSLVSAQSRKRYYWTNIPNITQPEQKGIVLRDILETREVEGLTDKAIAYMNRSSDKWSGGKTRKDIYIKDESEKSMCLTANMYKGVPYGVIAVDKPVKVGMNVEEVKVRKHDIDIEELKKFLISAKDTSGKGNKQIAKEMDCKYTHVEHWFRKGDFFAIPGDDIWFDLKKCIGIQSEEWDQRIMEFEYRDGVYETKQRVYSENGKSPTLTAGNSEQYIETSDKPIQVGIATDINGHDILKRVYSEDGKSPTVNTCQGGNREPKVVVDKAYWRKLTPLECERLQTVPDNYTDHVSNSQRFKMLGNGWTIAVIKHIFKNMERE